MPDGKWDVGWEMALIVRHGMCESMALVIDHDGRMSEYSTSQVHPWEDVRKLARKAIRDYRKENPEHCYDD
jgi:hypothetical protein